MVMAREWYVKPTARLRAQYNDNLLLRQKPVNGKIPEAYGYQATLLGVGGVRSELSNIALTAELDVHRYWGQKNLDRENWTVGLDSDYSLTERSKLGLDASYISDTTLTGQLDAAANLTPGVDDTTGILAGSLEGRQIGRKSFNIAPSWNYLLSETKSVNATYGHQEVSYDNALGNIGSLRDYKTDSVELAYSEQWSASTRYNVSFNALHYVITDFDTKNYSLTFGIEHKYSDTLGFNFFAGVRKTDTEAARQLYGSANGNQFFIDGDRPTTEQLASEAVYGPLFGAGLTKQFERAAVSFNYMRSTNPSGIGLLLVSDAINANASYKLTEHLNFMLSGTARFSAGAGSNGSNDFNSNYYSLGPTLSWVFSKQLSLNGGYNYQTQQYDNAVLRGNAISNGDAISNSYFVYFDYHLDDLTSNRF